jgi:hypothetical protein
VHDHVGIVVIIRWNRTGVGNEIFAHGSLRGGYPDIPNSKYQLLSVRAVLLSHSLCGLNKIEIVQLIEFVNEIENF